jgi:transcription initiation factor TFIID subunit 3
MSTALLHHALLRPAILQILRASGFHAARPSVIDALTDLAGRYLALLAARAAFHANSNHGDSIPDITDVRLALADCGLLTPALTATEEAWRELLRTPLSEIPERNGLRRVEEVKRDEEDTEDVKEFVKWFDGPVNKEIQRIAGLLNDSKQQLVAGEGSNEVHDYLTGKPFISSNWPELIFTVLKKKHSKTGEESRFQNTVLGIGSDFKRVKIDGGPETLADWIKSYKHNKPSADENSQLSTTEDTSMIL